MGHVGLGLGWALKVMCKEVNPFISQLESPNTSPKLEVDFQFVWQATMQLAALGYWVERVARKFQPKSNQFINRVKDVNLSTELWGSICVGLEGQVKNCNLQNSR